MAQASACAGDARTFNLEQSVHSSQGIDVKSVLDWGHQVLLAIEYLHSFGLVHRDISTSNILVTQDASGSVVLQLADFGLAVLQSQSEQCQGAGTRFYIAPEAMPSKNGLDVMSPGVVRLENDLFSAGIVLAEFASKCPPGMEVALVAQHGQDEAIGYASAPLLCCLLSSKQRIVSSIYAHIRTVSQVAWQAAWQSSIAAVCMNTSVEMRSPCKLACKQHCFDAHGTMV